jgi:hypothetical protein
MHKEILNKKQLDLLPLLASFKREFYLAGGTAIALHIGHRRSIDFDLFKKSELNTKKIVSKLSVNNIPILITRNVSGQLDLVLNDVKLTFLEYPFNIYSECNFEQYLKLPSLLELAAMKAYAIGRRSKWKDYVDLYFILKYHFSITEISRKANEIYEQLFSEKLFRAQLCFFEDIDYTEAVEYLVQPVTEEDIKSFLVEVATDLFDSTQIN